MSKQKGRVLFFFCIGVFLSLINCSSLWAGKPDWQLPLEPGYSYMITVQYGGLAYSGKIDKYHDNEHSYYALDFDNPVNNPEPKILATADGDVDFVYDNPNIGYGYGIIIDHGNGYKSIYGHLKELPLVKKGEKVYQGQEIGTMGNTGNSDGSHLHFAVTYNGLCKKEVLESKPEPISGYSGDDLKVNNYVTSNSVFGLTRFTFPLHSSQGWSVGNNTYAVPFYEQDGSRDNAWRVRVIGPNPGVVSPNLAIGFPAKDLQFSVNVRIDGASKNGFLRLYVLDEYGSWDNMLILGTYNTANNCKYIGYTVKGDALGSIAVKRISLELSDQADSNYQVTWSLSLVDITPRATYWNFENNNLNWTALDAVTTGYPSGDNWMINPSGSNPGVVSPPLRDLNLNFYNLPKIGIRFSVKLKDCSGNTPGNENNDACLYSPEHLAYTRLMTQNADALRPTAYIRWVGSSNFGGETTLKEEKTGSSKVIADGLPHTYWMNTYAWANGGSSIDAIKIDPISTALLPLPEEDFLSDLDAVTINWIAIVADTGDLSKVNNLRSGIEADKVVNLSWNRPFEVPAGKTLSEYRITVIDDSSWAVLKTITTSQREISYGPLSYGRRVMFQVAPVYNDKSVGPIFSLYSPTMPSDYTGTLLAATDLVAYPDSQDAINLHWQDNQTDYPNFYYEVYYGNVMLGKTGDTSFTDRNLYPNTNYCYRVVKRAGSKTSASTATVCATTLPSPRLDRPTYLRVYLNPEDHKNYLTWTEVKGAVGYKVCYGTGTTGPNGYEINYSQNNITVTTNNLVLSDLETDSYYLFTVEALSSDPTLNSEKSYTLAAYLSSTYYNLTTVLGQNYHLGQSVAWNNGLAYVGIPGMSVFTGTYKYYGGVISYNESGVGQESNIFSPHDYKTMGDFGYYFSFSTDGQKIAVSSPGACGISTPTCGDTGMVCVYEWDTTANHWGRDACFADSNLGNSRFGEKTVWLNENRLAISAPDNNQTGSLYGAVYIYQKNGAGTWVKETKLYPDQVSGKTGFGDSLAYLPSSNTLLVGADKEVGTGGQAQAGAVYIFRENNGTWTKVKKLRSDNQQVQEYYGYSLALDAERLFVGAPGNNNQGSRAGAIFLYGSDFSFVKKIYAKSALEESYFGNSLSLSGDVLAVGAKGSDSVGKSYSGRVHILSKNNGVWAEDRMLVNYNYGVWRFGSAVALNGDKLLVGAEGSYGVADSDYGLGAAFIYDLNKF